LSRCNFPADISGGGRTGNVEVGLVNSNCIEMVVIMAVLTILVNVVVMVVVMIIISSEFEIDTYGDGCDMILPTMMLIVNESSGEGSDICSSD
jgi:hypothetical protein